MNRMMMMMMYQRNFLFSSSSSSVYKEFIHFLLSYYLILAVCFKLIMIQKTECFKSHNQWFTRPDNKIK